MAVFAVNADPGTAATLEIGQRTACITSVSPQLRGTATLREPGASPTRPAPTGDPPDDPTTCMHPIWWGAYEVDDAGNITGTGELGELRDDNCGGVVATQSVELTGHQAGDRMVITLTFGPAEVTQGEPTCYEDRVEECRV